MSLSNRAKSAGADGFSALADPTRREIVALLIKRDRTVNEIATRFPISRPAISKHLRILRSAGLVRAEKHGRDRLQRFNDGGLQPVSDWIKRYEAFWLRRLETLRDLVEEDQ